MVRTVYAIPMNTSMRTSIRSQKMKKSVTLGSKAIVRRYTKVNKKVKGENMTSTGRGS